MKRFKKPVVFVSQNLESIKIFLLSRLHWGRGNFYKNVVHISMIAITATIAISGVVFRIAAADSASSLSGQDSYGSNDLLTQGGSITTVLTSSANQVATDIYVVSSGDSLQSIADNYQVKTDTIRWYNTDLVSPFSDEIQVGWELKIPVTPDGKGINGVLYEVRTGQTLDDVVSATNTNNEESNASNIIDFNQLQAPYTLEVGQKLFIPDGNLNVNEIVIAGIPTGVFSNPVADPSCSGYSLSRGYTFYHNGLDLARWPGCTIQAVAAGVIDYAGCKSTAEGCHIKINHGGGIVTHYYHGSGKFYVKAGDRVVQGQSIMEMGTTGNSTGVHLHFSLLKDGVFVDPAPYVPY